MIDDRFMYVFVRTDLPLAQQLVQSNHATFGMTAKYQSSGEPNIVMIGIPSEKSLNKVLKKLQASNIPHFEWREPDLDLGFTALATIPLDRTQKELFRHYPTWKLDATVAQLREHSVFNGEAVGENPSSGSIPCLSTGC